MSQMADICRVLAAFGRPDARSRPPDEIACCPSLSEQIFVEPIIDMACSGCAKAGSDQMNEGS